MDETDSHIWVKICGIRRPADLSAAIEAGADAVGLVFDPSSSRAVGADEAARLVGLAGDTILCVGVFRDAPSSVVAATVDEVGLGGVQYYGAVDEFCALRVALPHLRFAAYAVSVGSSLALPGFAGLSVGRGGESVLPILDDLHAAFRPPEARPDVFLFDSGRPGSGRTWNWGLLASYFGPVPFVLAGGLGPDNVADAIAAVRPWGVDASSSLETRPGVKDPRLIREFVAAVRRATGIRATTGHRSEKPSG